MAEKNTEDDSSPDPDDQPAPKASSPKPAAKPAAGKPAAAKAADPSAPSGTAAPRRKPVQPVAVHGPDSFIDRLQPHIKKIAVGAVALFAVIGVWVGWRWMKRRGAAKDTTHMAAALAISETPVRPADQKTPFEPEDAPKFTTEKDKAAAAADAIAAAGKVGESAGVYRAGLLLDAGRLDEAEAAYRAHIADAGDEGALAREGLGYVLEARAAAAKDPGERDKLYHQALDAFKDEQPDDKGPRRDFALYDQARILVVLGQNAEAKAALDGALKAVPDTELKPEIEQRLALIGGS